MSSLTTADIDLVGMLRAVVRNWIVVALCLALSLAFGFFYLSRATFLHTVHLEVTPVQTGFRSPSAQFGNLANLAGIGLPSNAEENNFKTYLQALRSFTTAEALAANPELLKKLFPQEWSEAENRWVERRSARRSAVQGLKAFLGIPSAPWTPPDAQRVHEYLLKNIRIVQTRDNPVVTVLVNVIEPAFGVLLLDSIHEAADKFLKSRKLLRAQSSIEYLSKKLNEVSAQDYRQELLQQLMDQEKVVMLISSNLPFVAEPLGGPVASRNPTLPVPTMVIGYAILIGLFLGIPLALLRDRMRGARQPDSSRFDGSEGMAQEVR